MLASARADQYIQVLSFKLADMCGMCLGTVGFGRLEVKETVQINRGFCTQHTWMRGEDGSGIPPYYLIMTSDCGTNRNSLWVSKFAGPGC